MSYILEALKKAEQKREQEQTPQFLGFGERRGAAPKKRRIWPYVLIGVLCVNAAIMAWWIGRWDDGDRTPAATSERAVAPVPSASSTAQLTPPAAVQVHPSVAPPVTNKEGYQDHRAGRGAQAQAAGTSTDPGAHNDAPHVVSPVPAQALSESRPRVEMQPMPEKRVSKDRVLTISELPAVIKSALPEFKVSGHAYTPEPQTRVVRINEKILQEGQDLSPGVKIEEIVPGGVILTYQGYRFRVPVSNR